MSSTTQVRLYSIVTVICISCLCTSCHRNKDIGSDPSTRLVKALDAIQPNAVKYTVLKRKAEDPDIAKHEEAFKIWLTNVLSDKEVENERRALYRRYYTDKEMKELSVFLESPVGQKFLSLIPEINAQETQLHHKSSEKHLPELQNLLEKGK